MGINVQEAVKRSIQTEKNAMNFYQLGSQKMKDPDARHVFDVLAKEEREHAGHFYKIYTGTVQAQYADLGAIKIGQGYVLDDRFLVVIFTYPHHRVDNFVRFHCHFSSSR